MERAKGRRRAKRGSISRPFRANHLFGWFPRVETLGFYEADFVKARGENCFLFIFASFWPISDNSSALCPFGGLIFAVRGLPSAAMIKPPKTVTAFQRAT
jgi:hypothetical protein